jgi:SAM-dependent methyltransferase
MTDFDNYFEANRELWNKRTPIHRDSDFYDLEGFKAGRNVLAEIEMAELANDVKGKSLLHLQCHFGLDTLCFARLGAKVTGIDISDEAITTAQNVAKETNIEADFVRCNVYDTRQYVKDQFDIVFTSYGTIGWLPNLNLWAKVVADSTKQGGTFYMADFHPVVWMMDDDFTHLKYPYFNAGVIEEENETTYTDGDSFSKAKEYGWNHSISDILNALLKQGFELQFFNEHNFSPYNCFSNTVKVGDNRWQIKGLEGVLPMVYSFKMVKK